MFSIFLLIIIYIAFISLGLPDSMLGAAWPAMYTDLGVPISFAGFLTLTTCLGTVVSSLFYSGLRKRFRTETITVVSVLLTATALLLYSKITSFYLLLPAAFVLGIGGGAVDAGLNTYVAIHYKARAMNFLHAFWGIGTIVGPFLLSYFFSHGISWRMGYTSVGSIQMAVFVIILVTLPIWKKVTDSDNLEAADNIKSGDSSNMVVLKRKGVKPALLGFFSYCAMEQTAMLWSATYLVTTRGFSEGDAATAAGLLFWGITMGRIISGLVADKLGDSLMIRISHILILIGVLLLISLPSGLSAIVLFMIGIGCGPIYPAMLHQTPFYFGRENASRVMGLEMTAAYVSCAVIPPLFGIIGRHISMAIMPFWMLFFLAMNFIVIEMKKKAGKAE